MRPKPPASLATREDVQKPLVDGELLRFEFIGEARDQAGLVSLVSGPRVRGRGSHFAQKEFGRCLPASHRGAGAMNSLSVRVASIFPRRVTFPSGNAVADFLAAGRSPSVFGGIRDTGGLAPCR